MAKQVKEITMVRVETAIIAELKDYLRISGAPLSHVTGEALKNWIEQEMPKRMKVMVR